MTKEEKRRYMDMPTVAVWSDGLFGVEIKSIEYGIEDYVVFVVSDRVYRDKIYYTTSRTYFRWLGRTIRLDECIRGCVM